MNSNFEHTKSTEDLHQLHHKRQSIIQRTFGIHQTGYTIVVRVLRLDIQHNIGLDLVDLFFIALKYSEVTRAYDIRQL